MKREAARSITAVSVAAVLTIQTAMPAAAALAQETSVASDAPAVSYAQEADAPLPVVVETPADEADPASGEGEQQAPEVGTEGADAPESSAVPDAPATDEPAGAPTASDAGDAPVQGEGAATDADVAHPADADVAPVEEAAADEAAKPVPGADAPTSPTDDSMAAGSIYDFLTQEEIDEASVATLATRTGKTTFASMLVYANQYRGLPYVWGGKDYDRDGGFDCSGFVIWVLDNVAGLDIDGDMVNAASLYESYCTPVSREEAQPGDLVFFKGTYGGANYISHVGLYCGNGVMIDAGNPINYHNIDLIKAEGGAKAPIVFGRVKGLTLTQTNTVEGWRSENGAMYFYENGKKVTGEKEIYGHWYYFDPEKDGAMATGFVRLTGAYLANGPKTVYYDKYGSMVTGEYEIDGSWYYFDPARGGDMATGRFVRLTGAYLANGPKTVYYDDQGHMVTGEVEVGGHWYYLDPTKGGALAMGFVRLTGAYLANGPKTVYYDDQGRMLTGEQEIGGAWYYFDPGSGAMATGFVRLTGAYLANGPKTVYYDDNGRMVEGERQIGGHWYYFGPGGAMATGFVRLTGAYLANGPKTVYYDEQGRMVTGTRVIGGVTCRFDAGSGALVSPAMSYLDAAALGSANLSYVSHSVPTVNQLSEGAVMGCEGAALYMALRGAGALGGVSFASFLNTMPLASDANPNHGFVGSPWDYEEDTGIYQSIYPSALASWGSRYGAVRDISGTSTLGLAGQLQAGRNVVVYVTADFRPVQWKSYFFGSAVNNAHVMTLVGFDPTSGRFQVADPKYGSTYWVDWATFDAAYSAQRFAVAVG